MRSILLGGLVIAYALLIAVLLEKVIMANDEGTNDKTSWQDKVTNAAKTVGSWLQKVPYIVWTHVAAFAVGFFFGRF